MEKIIKERNKQKECPVCIHFRGLWRMGQASPMGRLDASDGMPTQCCPSCGMSYNDVDLKIRKKSRDFVKNLK